MSQKTPHNATVVGLIGELGSGKTTFVQKFAKSYGVKETVISPTFNIIKQYGNLVHIDAYRLKNAKELEKLGIQEIFSNPKNIVFIEWADRVRDILPEDTITIRFEHVSKNKRKISID
ncbi:MAG: tRNA (adenosine(37)-N6)-threonylcarbamoyltransferase complex ATPase subunit type 1 TsaE [Patescibacteria group bacterium]